MRFLELPRQEFLDSRLTYVYDATARYDVTLERRGDGFSIALSSRPTQRRHLEYSEPLFASGLEDPHAYALVDHLGERVGYVETALEKDDILRIVNLMVEDGYRRRGYGSLLISKAKTQARALRCSALTISVSQGNAGAIRFLLGQGFTLSGFNSLPSEESVDLSVFFTETPTSS
ncbi:MAG: GNAT family N-acetyltransferase [Clostridia bacterium]|nr:GNAT family N-acetyltransferase [Clostridia bacterium]